jgi:cytolysin (calcineurin-like family phosphatase)
MQPVSKADIQAIHEHLDNLSMAVQSMGETLTTGIDTLKAVAALDRRQWTPEEAARVDRFLTALEGQGVIAAQLHRDATGLMMDVRSRLLVMTTAAVGVG